MVDDNVTKLAVLIDADNAQLTVISSCASWNMAQLLRSENRSLGIFDILGQRRRRRSQYGAVLNFPTINRPEYQSLRQYLGIKTHNRPPFSCIAGASQVTGAFLISNA
jgi:hypothetical protein